MDNYTDAVENPCIFVTSLGRTGTQFFGYKMSEMIENCVSVHEPDVFWMHDLEETLRRARQIGFFRMTFGRVLPRYSMGLLGIARARGACDDGHAIQYLRAARARFLKEMQGRIFLEANNQLKGLVDLLPAAFANSRTVFVIRDPRTWVQSYMNKRGSFYSRYDIRSWFRNGRLKPHHLQGDLCRKRWNGMNQFEKLCWVWDRENRFALACAEKHEGIRIFRFEDLLGPRKKEKTFLDLLHFVTHFPDGIQANWKWKKTILEKKIHSTKKESFRSWTTWPRTLVRTMNVHCGELMERFNYGSETEWRELSDGPGI